jgi:biopolymer transport protein ExbB/TolQ
LSAAWGFSLPLRKIPQLISETNSALRALWPAWPASCWNNDARAEKTRIAFTNEQARIEKHLGIISVVATLLPLLGLLGTVTGMIASFNAIAAYGSGNPSVVADGIAEALITTEAGLITSIPLLYLHQVLSNRADTLARRLDEFTTHLLHIFIREEK